MNIIGKLIIAIVVLVIVYYLYRWYFAGDASTTIISGPIVAENAKVSARNLGRSVSNIPTTLYSFSIWIFITDWSYRINDEKILFSRIDGNGNVAPQLSLGARDNTVSAMVDVDNASPTVCQVTQVPIQTWVNIIVVQNQQVLDMYIDGKLTRTCVLDGVASIDTNPGNQGLWVCPPTAPKSDAGFDGYLSSFRAFPYPLNPRQAYEVYREGHEGISVSLFNKYRLKLAFLKGNREMGSFEI